MVNTHHMMFTITMVMIMVMIIPNTLPFYITSEHQLNSMFMGGSIGGPIGGLVRLLGAWRQDLGF